MVTQSNRMMNIFGSKGWAKVIGLDAIEIEKIDGTSETRHVNAVNIVKANMEGFADAISGIRKYKFTTEEMIHDVAVLEALERSLKTGKREIVI